MNPSNWQSSVGREKQKQKHVHMVCRGMHMEWTILHLFIRDTPINACYDLRQKNKRITCILETTTKIVRVCMFFFFTFVWSAMCNTHTFMVGYPFFPLFDFVLFSFSFSFCLSSMNEWMIERHAIVDSIWISKLRILNWILASETNNRGKNWFSRHFFEKKNPNGFEWL